MLMILYAPFSIMEMQRHSIKCFQSVCPNSVYGRKRCFSFLGFEFYWGRDKKGISRVKRRTAPDRLCMALNNFTSWIKRCRHVPIKDIMGSLRAKLRGYYNYYGVKDNIAQLWKYFFHLQGILFKWLNRRSQRRSYTWKGFKELLL